jgi:NADH-quinone oxidoreductase subunit F
LRNSFIDPEDINEYIARDGYKAARKAFTEMTSEEVCQTMIDSGLRGRGGGGFPTGLKWKFTLPYKNETKYVICNGDEGDPGAFMDRSVMEGNPHSVIEGMMVAAKAIEGTEGYVYVRAEYPLAVKRMQKAVEDAEAAGILGDNIFGTGKSFKITVMEGAGAFVCGEETALIASIEGRRGEPVPKPPFPAERGLWGKPTTINNVETLSVVPYIILNGPEDFRKNGTDSSPGTKTFALTGHVANTGLIEVPFGTTLREIVYDIGGGVIDKDGNLTGGEFKAVQIGGPSGGCLTKDMADTPLDFDSLKEVGAMVGSGGLVVMNEDTCMVDVAKFFLSFTLNESCGKCTPCRIGNKRLHEMLTDITEGRGTMETLEKLEDLAINIKKTSLCGLGQTSPNPVLSTLKYFREEYEAHVVEGRCPAGVCEKLTKYVINDACIGCTLCARKCPVNCIDGAKKEKHTINQDECIKCGACFDACNFNAIYKI